MRSVGQKMAKLAFCPRVLLVKISFLKKVLIWSISDQKTLRTKKLRIKKIHHHAKIQLKNFKNEGVISDLEILLVMKNLVTLQKSFGMVSRGYTPILVKISITVRQIYRPVPPEKFWANPFFCETIKVDQNDSCRK